MSCTTENLISALRALEEGISNVMTKAQGVLTGCTAEEFADGKAGVLLPIIKMYADCFQRTDVSNREELELLISKQFSSVDLQDQFTELEETEREYNAMLEGIDKHLLSSSAKPLREGDTLPLDVVLQKVQDSSLAEFNAAGGHVIVVSFGVMEGAKQWLNEVQCSFEMFLDSERRIYQSVGLGRSITKVWNTETLGYYAAQMKAERKLPQSYKDVQDDPHQMGGDIVIDPHGVIKMVYCSKKAQDRPPVQSLLDALNTKCAD